MIGIASYISPVIMASSDMIDRADEASAGLEAAWQSELQHQQVSGKKRSRGEWQSGTLSQNRFFPEGEPPYVVSHCLELFPHSCACASVHTASDRG